MNRRIKPSLSERFEDTSMRSRIHDTLLISARFWLPVKTAIAVGKKSWKSTIFFPTISLHFLFWSGSDDKRFDTKHGICGKTLAEDCRRYVRGQHFLYSSLATAESLQPDVRQRRISAKWQIQSHIWGTFEASIHLITKLAIPSRVTQVKYYRIYRSICSVQIR